MGLSVGIVGAGIAGLAVAALLRDRGHDVVLHDQFDTPAPVGSGLVIQPVGQRVLDDIGVGDRARQKGAVLVRMQGRAAVSGRRVLDVSYARRGAETFGLAIHRATLFDILYQAVVARDIPVETAFQVASVEDHRFVSEAGRVSSRFDLLVDASGVHSRLSPLRPQPLGYGAVWGVVNWPEKTALHDRWLTQRYQSARHMIGAMPIGSLPGETQQKAAIFWSLPSDSEDRFRAQDRQDWVEQVVALWPDFAPFAEQVSDLSELTMARYAHGTLSRPYDGDVVYLGDAAHCASPQLGQGANMALLDAMAFARALDGADRGAAVIRYAAYRRWHVRVYQACSWAFTPMYQSDSRVLPWLRDRVLFPLSLVPPVPSVLNRLVCGDLVAPLGR